MNRAMGEHFDDLAERVFDLAHQAQEATFLLDCSELCVSLHSRSGQFCGNPTQCPVAAATIDTAIHPKIDCISTQLES